MSVGHETFKLGDCSFIRFQSLNFQQMLAINHFKKFQQALGSTLLSGNSSLRLVNGFYCLLCIAHLKVKLYLLKGD